MEHFIRFRALNAERQRVAATFEFWINGEGPATATAPLGQATIDVPDGATVEARAVSGKHVSPRVVLDADAVDFDFLFDVV